MSPFLAQSKRGRVPEAIKTFEGNPVARISNRPSPKLFTRVLSPGALLFLLILISARVFAGGATLAWDPVNSPSLVGYMVYYGPAAGNYTSSIDVGNTTTYTVPNLVEGSTYHFAATAYDATHTQSGFSNDASATVPYSAPVAQFSASTTSGTAPLAMNFLNTSTGTISTYAWTFGDGGTSSAQGPAHMYSSAGVYSVGLTVTGPGGSNTKTNSNYITVLASPLVASFSASTTSGNAPLTVNFTSTSTGTISTYAWTFGDGGTSNVQNPSHVYSAAGVYTVGLTVTGPAGSNTKTNSSYINVSTTAPVAGLSATPTSGTVPLTVNFTSTSTGTIGTYAWNFGDGGTSNLQNPSHVYAAAGAYTVSLTVTGPGGSNTKTNSSYINVSTTAPVAGFSATPTSGTVPLTANFTSTSSGSITAYAWNFGDGGTSNLKNPSHMYAAAGAYAVSLTVSGATGSNTKTSSNYVTVMPPTGSTCPCTLWTSAAKPTVAADPDTSAVELGVKFKSDRSGCNHRDPLLQVEREQWNARRQSVDQRRYNCSHARPFPTRPLQAGSR